MTEPAEVVDAEQTETICLKDTRKVARDNTVKYHWRVLQLLAGADRPNYAGLRMDVLERADGELMIRYQGEAVDFQDGPPPSSVLWGATSPCSPGPGLQGVADGVTNGHLNEAQRERLAALESSDEDEANVEDMVTRGRGGKANPLRHQLRRAPTERPSMLAGRRCNRPRSMGFPSGPSHRSWAWPETPSESTPRQKARPPRSSAPESDPRPRPCPQH